MSVRVPPGWTVAPERLTPYLGDPREILALGTYPLRAGGDRCAHQPVNAIEDLGDDDAFMAVFERVPPYPASGYPPRPPRFALPTAEGTNRFCVPGRDRLDEWMAFSDSGRAFYLLVALGTSASDETREELQAVLASLELARR